MYLMLVLFVVTVLNGGDSAKSESSAFNSKENYCPYFKNRAPKPQPDLKNCTWYKEKACCLQTEIDLIFPLVLPPLGASDKCLRYSNSLMCYVCAPDQNVFYKDERLTVCESFCDKWFAACGAAKLKGMKVNDLFESGKDFCLARKFLVESASETDCFSFEQKILNSAISSLVAFPSLWFSGISTLLILYVILWMQVGCSRGKWCLVFLLCSECLLLERMILCRCLLRYNLFQGWRFQGCCVTRRKN